MNKEHIGGFAHSESGDKIYEYRRSIYLIIKPLLYQIKVVEKRVSRGSVTIRGSLEGIDLKTRELLKPLEIAILCDGGRYAPFGAIVTLNGNEFECMVYTD